jgi:lipoprotein-releasing system permease protein
MRMVPDPHSDAPKAREPRRRLTDRWFELLMASRLLRSRRSVHLSLVTAMSVAGIGLGVAALIVVLAVNTGFQAAFQDRILATYPHVVIMRRGVDLHDYRDVVQRLERLPGVRLVAPATYDDMMLSSATGRAGAVVRGVPVQTLDGLPEGAVVQGKLDPRGEKPVVVLQGQDLTVKSAITGGRHVLIVAAGQVRAVPVLQPVVGAAQLVVFDARGCPKPGQHATETIHLINPDTGDTTRHTTRISCDVAASWEAGPGHWLLRWLDGAVQHEQTLELASGSATVAVIDGARVLQVPTPPEDLNPSLAGVAVAVVDAAPIHVHLPGGSVTEVTAVSEWLGMHGELPAIALGEGLAKRLQVKLGEEVRAVSPLRGMDRGAEGAAGSASGRFRVATILRTGFHDHDQRLAIVDFDAAQRFLGRGDIARWVEVRVDDPILARSRVDAFRAALEPTDLYEVLTGARQLQDKMTEIQAAPIAGVELRAPDDAVAVVDDWVSGLRAARSIRTRTTGNWRVMDWEEMNRNIFDAARMQKIAMSLFPFIIVLVAALNVVGTQAVVVHERAREIAILRAMGATRRSVASIFLAQGLAVGLLGTFLGLATGGLACLLLDAVGYPLDPQVYLISRLPVLVEPASFFLAGGAATLLAFAAAWYSAQRAATRPPVEALRRLD